MAQPLKHPQSESGSPVHLATAGASDSALILTIRLTNVCIIIIIIIITVEAAKARRLI